ncbi:DNA internalization-related competence protein ComEC/Rec2 [Marinobacter sp.]|uniref:DNA internalization-related competence protein ComEC/Rec2 n=1 Tax=Marinobacter sp. TaxID=50741 RepID=UPI0025C0109A|nr:DNA internalization-related competence protein ComEC/Rec2 [Marinobacter sp.]
MSGSFMARVGLVGFACGVILLYSLAVLPPLHWLMSATLIPFVAIRLVRPPPFRAVAVLLAGGIAGLAWAAMQADGRQQSVLPPALEGQTLDVSGYLCDVPSEGSFGSVRFGFCVTQWHLPEGGNTYPSDELPDQLRLAWYGDDVTNTPGHRLTLTVVLKRPHGAVNPTGFRYESWLYRKGFGATGTVRELSRADHLECPLRCRYHRWRGELVDATSDRLSDARHFPLITSLMMGYRGHMQPEHWDVLKATGTIHLVAISGLHLGLIAAGAGFLCRRLLLCLPERRVSPTRLRLLVFLVVASASVGYALVAGFSVPTRRALIMVIIAGWVLVGARQTGVFTGLLTALVLVLLSDSFSPLDQGFWLSFGAVTVLVMLFALRVGRVGWLAGLLLAQMAVFAGLWPILSSLGQSQPVIGLVANLFAIPWVSLVVMPLLALGASTLVFLPAGDALVISMLDGVFGVLWQGLSWLANVDIVLTAPGPLQIVGFSLVVLMALVVPFGGYRKVSACVVLLWIAVFVFRGNEMGQPNETVAHPELWVWDVGQGLSVMLREQDQVLVYDTGPALEGIYSSVESVLIPNLSALGVRRIDTLVISHGDGDHAGGLPLLFDRFEVGRVITGETGRVAGKLPEGVNVEPCSGQVDVRMGELELAFWRSPGRVEGNDASCVLTVSSTVPSVEVVLPGDITRRVEEAFMARADTLGNDADHYRVVLAPHHGSKTSSSKSWVARMVPDLALFSAGYRHRFGHPHADVVERYRSVGSDIVNTATSGAIRLVLEPGGVLTTKARAGAPFWIRKPELP